MVARAGANIPAPLAIPLICTPEACTVDIFGIESVVIIASAQSSNASFDKLAAITSIPFRTLSIGKKSPIIPVEQTKISEEE